VRGPPLCILFVGTLRVTFSCDCLESECAGQPPRTGALSLHDQNGGCSVGAAVVRPDHMYCSNHILRHVCTYAVVDCRSI
jgi:hypothetical protein